MKTHATLLAALLFIGCHAQKPVEGMAGAEVRVVAKPKSGKVEAWPRVAVYDAAPVRAAPAGQFEHVDYANLSDVIVWLESKDGVKLKYSPVPVEIEVDPARPHAGVGAVSVGQTIRMTNRSSKPQLIYSVSEGNEFEFPSVAPGATVEYAPKAEGLIEILYNTARPPVAQVYAAPSPWVKRTTGNKSVTFLNLPPGEYEAVAWHPRLPGGTARVATTRGAVAHAQVNVGVGAMSAAGAGDNGPGNPQR